MGKLELGYSDLAKLNPGIIMVSITPFGQSGPYKDYKAPGIVAWAMGGHAYSCGDADRPPVQISHHPQAYLHAGAEGAVGAMVALHDRETTGRGQQVDVSIQACVAQTVHTSIWQMMNVVIPRGGLPANINVRMKRVWPCKDGYVIWLYAGGAIGKRMSLPLLEWMEEEGMADDFLKGIDWETLELRTIEQEVYDRMIEPTVRFFMTHTKAELLDGAVKHRVHLYPVSTVADFVGSVQLAAREFWVELEHPELGTTITYPGAFAQSSQASPRISRRAPLIGEHNQEIYEKELGIASKELVILKQAKAI